MVRGPAKEIRLVNTSTHQEKLVTLQDMLAGTASVSDIASELSKLDQPAKVDANHAVVKLVDDKLREEPVAVKSSLPTPRTQHLQDASQPLQTGEVVHILIESAGSPVRLEFKVRAVQRCRELLAVLIDENSSAENQFSFVDNSQPFAVRIKKNQLLDPTVYQVRFMGWCLSLFNCRLFLLVIEEEFSQT